MTYSKQTWANDASGGTPITAARLNNMENGIAAAASTADAAIPSTQKGTSSGVASLDSNGKLPGSQGGWVQMTAAAFAALATKDPNTLYVIVG